MSQSVTQPANDQAFNNQALRADLAIIAQWIKPGSKVLDLGCGDGTLLAHLRKQRNTQGYGLEIDPFNIEHCVRKNINVIQADLNNGLKAYFSGNSFDYVIMSQTLQATEQPDLLIEEMLRVGRGRDCYFPEYGTLECSLATGFERDHACHKKPSKSMV